MGKKLLIIVSLLLVALMAATGCNSTKWGPVNGAKASDPVSSNGGFLVEKGDYLYFINGAATVSDDNTFGTPVQGALVAVKKDLSEEPFVVIPKLMVASDKTSGIYIYGDWIYYATPTADKDKTGTVQSSYLDFCRTKLDGTKTEKFMHITDNTAKYRFTELNGTVYLTYIMSNAIYSYNTAEDETVTIVESVSSSVFSEDEGYPYVFYTKLVTLDEENGTTASYNKAYRVKMDGSESAEILSGVPKTEGGAEISSTGLVITLMRHFDGALYYRTSYVDNSIFMGIFAIKDADIKEDAVANINGALKISASQKHTDGIILGFDDAGKSLGYVYFDSTIGLMRYIYDENGNMQRYRIIDELTSVLICAKDGYLYYSTGTDLRRVKYDEYEQSASDAEVLADNLYSTAWYKPEFVGDKLFFCDNTDSYNYIRYITLGAEEYDPQFIGIYSPAHQEAVDKSREDALNELKEKYESYKDSDDYTEEGLKALEKAYNDAVEALNSAKRSDDITEAKEAGLEALDGVEKK